MNTLLSERTYIVNLLDPCALEHRFITTITKFRSHKGNCGMWDLIVNFYLLCFGGYRTKIKLSTQPLLLQYLFSLTGVMAEITILILILQII